MRSCYNPENFKNAYPPTKFETVPVMFSKKVIPASAGTSAEGQPLAPKVGAYYNALVIYEADQTYYIYDSYGVPTKLPVSTEINTYTKGEINQLISDAIGQEATLREGEDQTLSNSIGTIAGDLATEISDRGIADTNLQNAINNEAGTRSTTDTSLQNQINSVKSTADTAIQPSDINVSVVSDVSVGTNSSTTTVELEAGKVNLADHTTATSYITMPVASTSQAGIMNKATYDAITANANNIEALLNGAVAVTGLAASPSQQDITDAWETETGLTTLINRAGVYDIDNDKVWTYYTNTATWYAASNTAQVTINTFTNSSEGTIKGSTSDGQIFAESDGTGSVNGWDTLSSAVSGNTSKLSTIAQGAEVNVQSDWNEANSASDAYIQNKPTIHDILSGTSAPNNSQGQNGDLYVQYNA